MKIRVILMAALLSIVLVVSNSLAQTLKQKESILQKEPVLKVLAEPVTKPAVETVKPIIKEPLLVKSPEEKAPLTILEKESTPLNEKLLVADSLDVQNIKDIKEIKKISENLVMNSDNMIENIDMSDKLMNKLVSDEIEKVKIAEQNVIEAKAEELTVIEKVINEHYQALEIKSDLAVKTSEAIVDAQELKSKLEETNKAVLATNNLEQARQELTNMLNTSKELNTIKTDIVNDVKIIENDLRAKDPVGDEDKDNIINLMDAKPFEPQILEEAKVLKEEIIIPKTEIIEPTEKPKLTIQVPSFPEKAELTIQPPVEEEKEVSVAIVRNLDVLNQMVDLRIKEEEKIKEEIATENNKNTEDVKDPEVAVAREINAELVKLTINPSQDLDQDTVPDRNDDCGLVSALTPSLVRPPERGCPEEGLPVQEIKDLIHWQDMEIVSSAESGKVEETLVLTTEGVAAMEEAQQLAKSEEAPEYQASIDRAVTPAAGDVEDVEVGEGPWAMRGARCDMNPQATMGNISYLWTLIMLLPIILKRRRR